MYRVKTGNDAQSGAFRWTGGRQPDCIFCRVIAGELPSREAYSGELTYAFHDLQAGGSGPRAGGPP